MIDGSKRRRGKILFWLNIAVELGNESLGGKKWHLQGEF